MSNTVGMVPTGGRHTCDAWMRYAKERCARKPGHLGFHRTRWAMDNALRMATGHETTRERKRAA
jgi:hypothetical protein